MFAAEITPPPAPGRRRFSCLTDERNAAEVDRAIAEWRAQTVALPVAIAAGAHAIPPDDDDGLCPHCGGSGSDPYTDGGDRCLACGGSGKRADAIERSEPADVRRNRQLDAAREAMTATVGVPVVSEATAALPSA